MTTNAELLPCPFCGCAMRIATNRDWHLLDGDHAETCMLDAGQGHMTPSTDDALAQLIRDWNTRAHLIQADGDEKIYTVPVQLVGSNVGEVRVRFVSRQHLKDKPTEANPSPIRVVMLGDLEKIVPPATAQSGSGEG